MRKFLTPKKVFSALIVIVTVLTICYCLQSAVLLTHPLVAWPILPRHLVETFVPSDKYSDDTGYDEEVSRWYRGSTCSRFRDVFVGSRALFPPCQPNLPPGVPTWGKFPFTGPFRYVNASKNPCWYEGGQLRCIPYFYLAGISKSGTSDLRARICLHPNIHLTRKEPHWFDRKRYKQFQGFDSYVALYTQFSHCIEENLQTQGWSGNITVDASPSYFYDSGEWPLYSGNEGCTEPRVILPSHIRHLNPDVRIILTFRHPVRRLYSRYLFDSNRLPSPRQFHDWVVEGLDKYRDCFNRWSLRHCVYNKTLWSSVHSLRIQESIYPVLLEDWLRVIPPKQILLLRFEDYASNKMAVLAQIFDFLGVEPLGKLDNGSVRAMATTQIRNAGRHYNVGPMLPDTERLLQEFYRPFIRRLAAIIGDKRFLWED